MIIYNDVHIGGMLENSLVKIDKINYEFIGYEQKSPVPTATVSQFLNDISDMSFLDRWKKKVGERNAHVITEQSRAFGIRMEADLLDMLNVNGPKINSQYKDAVYQDYNEVEDIYENLGQAYSYELGNIDSSDLMTAMHSKAKLAAHNCFKYLNDHFRSFHGTQPFIASRQLHLRGKIDFLMGDYESDKFHVVELKTCRNTPYEDQIKKYFHQAFIYSMTLRELIKHNQYPDDYAKYRPDAFTVMVWCRCEREPHLQPHLRVYESKLDDDKVKSDFIQDFNPWHLQKGWLNER